MVVARARLQCSMELERAITSYFNITVVIYLCTSWLLIDMLFLRRRVSWSFPFDEKGHNYYAKTHKCTTNSTHCYTQIKSICSSKEVGSLWWRDLLLFFFFLLFVVFLVLTFSGLSKSTLHAGGLDSWEGNGSHAHMALPRVMIFGRRVGNGNQFNGLCSSHTIGCHIDPI